MVNMSWVIAHQGGAYATTEARGDDAMVEFDTLAPHIRTAAPNLPFADAPGGANSRQIPYTAAAIMRAAFQ